MNIRSRFYYLSYVLGFILLSFATSHSAFAQETSDSRLRLLNETTGHISNLTTVVAWLEEVLAQNSRTLSEKSRSHGSYLDAVGTQHYAETVEQARLTQKIARAHLESINLLTRGNVLFARATELKRESRILELKAKIQELELRAWTVRSEIEVLVGGGSGGGDLSDPNLSTN